MHEADPFQTRTPHSEVRTPGPSSAGPPVDLQVHIGRFRVIKILGEGGFGRVYLAQDDQLHRPVAIKVPHAHLVTQTANAEAYLSEARAVANLDHPNIAPVFDVGSTDLFPCFIVSKYIDGTDLATRLKESPLPLHQAVELAATVAQALHHAHTQGVIHRDIKPGNILLDKNGKPFVADFGLALREQDVGKGPRYAGTPAYMSPEQARGEGHRVDGRSDIFSLGIVLYELLTGRRPFRGDGDEEVLNQIVSVEVRPSRQFDDRIPRELDRICLKALSKRITDRYPTAKDMAEDLWQFLAETGMGEEPMITGRRPHGADPAVRTSIPMHTPRDHRAVKIVPKGLRSFDAGDADFFLELLPGPRHRDGLPESIRFWKTRIEESEPENTFSVGLIYGPSGCGKSSLVKAGLLPRLAKSVPAVYVEATALGTEGRLLKGLRRQIADLPGDLNLPESLAALRRGQYLESGRKVLLVLDQFEQWLHAKRNQENTELAQALRQCDGGRVQCILLVRDDFWLAVSRFMTELEVELLQGRNVGLVDLFDPRHARKVLMAFGTAFGAFPEQEENLSKEHNAFLDQAVTGLCLDGKVISVRLVLFAEMIKGKPWTPATLRAVGGIRGVGATFLEETFTASTAPPQHRLHQQAAQAVLNALLPEAGADIKGHMRSRQELLEVSGYAGRLREFDELLRILDGELRLITPTDPEGMAGSGQQRAAGGGWRVADEEDKDTQGKAPVSSPATRHPPPATRYYQLTHDYLVHSLRDWLTRKQKETPGGRAELLLADRATVWNARRESRQLPSLWQWLQIRLLTQKKNWLPVQRLMMQDAGRYHAVRGLVLALVLVALWAVGLVVRSEIVEQNNAHHAAALVQTLLRSETPQVPAIVQDMAPYRRWLDPLLHDAFAKAEAHGDARQQLHASLALLPVDATQVEYLERRLLDAEPREVAVIRDALAGQHAELVERLWAVVEKPPKGKERRRLRAAAALAKYDPDSPRWDQRREAVANDLVALPSVYLATWMEYFRPVRDKLLAPLGVIYRDGKRRETERSLATDLVADYTSDRPAELADLLMDADEKQFAVLYPKFLLQQQRGLPVLLSEVERILPLDATEEEKEKLAKRQANAAVALLRMDQPEKVWPLLKHRPDARVRSYLLHRFGPLGVDAEVIVRRLQDERDITMRRALILSLGPEEFGEQAWTSEEKKLLVQQLQETYRTAGDPGLRAASEWLLRQWHEEAWLEQTDQAWAEDAPRRTKRLESIRQALAQEKPSPQWYVTGKGQTMVVIPGPVEFKMGSPATEAGRNPVEQQHRRRISRTFAIAAKPVTVKQYLAFQASYQYIKQNAPSDDCPVHGTTWKMAAEYCNWLSDQEGIPKEDWCYETDAKGAVTKLKAGYLSLTGYRLSTEAEWEFACRAGATTARYYGESEELLGKYGWYLANAQDRSWPVGSKKPNDLGFFDMHGNVACWCQDNFQEYPAASDDKVFEDKEGELEIAPTIARVLRGGSFINLARYVRSADRVRNFPLTRSINFGFRLARTLQ